MTKNENVKKEKQKNDRNIFEKKFSEETSKGFYK